MRKDKNKKIEKPANDLIYIRVSTGRQVESGFSLDSQEKICREFSEKTNHKILHIFREEGESAKTIDRTELQKMLRYCETNKKIIDRVVFYKIDRFARNNNDYTSLKICLARIGIRLISATEKFDDTATGRFHENILAAVAQLDNEVRSQRVIDGMKGRLEKGLWAGVAPWGYINTKDNTGGKIIVPHSEKSKLVKIIFEKYSTGKYTFLELAKMLNKSGVTSRHGTYITKQLISQIIKNHIYYGRILFPSFGIDVQGLHEPIISEQLFWEANLGKKGKNRRAPRSKDNPKYPLRGIKCNNCGGSISAGKSKSRSGKYYDYYSCINCQCIKKSAIKKKDMEDSFTNFLIRTTPNNEYLDVFAEAIKLSYKTELGSFIEMERKIKLKITELDSKKDKLMDLMIEGKINTEDFNLANEKIKAHLFEQQKELNNLSSPSLNLENIVDVGIFFIKNFPFLWKDLDVKDLRVLNDLLFMKKLAYDYPTIKTAEISCIYNILPELLPSKTGWVIPAGIEPAS